MTNYWLKNSQREEKLDFLVELSCNNMGSSRWCLENYRSRTLLSFHHSNNKQMSRQKAADVELCVKCAGRHTLKKPFMNRSFLISFLFLLLYFLNTIYLTSKTLISSQLRPFLSLSSMHHCCLYCMHLFKMNWKP